MICRTICIELKVSDMDPVPPDDQNISYYEHDDSECDMSPSANVMQNEISICVLATNEHGFALVY